MRRKNTRETQTARPYFFFIFFFLKDVACKITHTSWNCSRGTGRQVKRKTEGHSEGCSGRRQRRTCQLATIKSFPLPLCVRGKDSVHCPSLCTRLRRRAAASPGWMPQPVLVLGSVNAISEQQRPECCCLIPTPCKCDQGIRKTQLIGEVYSFSIGSQQRVANCFRYLYQRTNVFENSQTKRRLALLPHFFPLRPTRIIWIFHHPPRPPALSSVSLDGCDEGAGREEAQTLYHFYRIVLSIQTCVQSFFFFNGFWNVVPKSEVKKEKKHLK